MKPLIWIESVIEKFSHSRVEIKVKVKSDTNTQCLTSVLISLGPVRTLNCFLSGFSLRDQHAEVQKSDIKQNVQSLKFLFHFLFKQYNMLCMHLNFLTLISRFL